MHSAQIIRRSYHDPRIPGLTVNHDRVYSDEPREALEAVQRSADPIEKVEWIATVPVGPAEQSLVEDWRRLNASFHPGH